MRYEDFQQRLRAAGQYPGKPHKLFKLGANSKATQPASENLGRELIQVYARQSKAALRL